MKTRPKKTSTRTPLLIALAAVTLLVVSSLVYVYAFNGNIFGWKNHTAPSDEIPLTNLEKPTDEQIQAGNDIKNGNLDESGKNTDPTPPASEPGSTKQSVEVFMTALNQNNGVLQVRTQISRVINTGQCTLTLTRQGKTVTKTADIQATASASTCKGFDIPVSELSIGSWDVTLTYENDTLVGTDSEKITIQ